MKILVTGGAGYIGSHTIIDILENTDHEVVSIDNYSNSDAETFDRIEAITGKRVKNYDLDLTAYKSLKEMFFDEEGRIDGIIHFAALKAVGESVEKPVLYYHNNLNGLINLLKCVEKYDVKHFIFSSSCTVYGNAVQQPVTESTPLQQTESPYGYTKLVGEKILQDFTKTKSNFNSVSLRYFNPVGAHMSGMNGELPKGKPNNLVPIITQFVSGWIDQLHIYGDDYETRDGTPIRDYIHVSDVAHAHVLALESLASGSGKKAYDVFNLGTGNGVTVLEAIKAFEKVNDIKVNFKLGPRRAGDVQSIYADNSKAVKELGWHTNYTIEDAMSSAWKWQQRLNAVRHGDTVHHVES
ncbi:MAG: UDP-glucose 4-epimerase GalE [Flavobacteriales bacterium]